ncbi:MAG TPA: pyridoxine 5'-phosphate synthase [Tepidisphaeraceae bacterium]|nr:pyridoxine 5'-phosphate synthase [Tepidisphaeraceae bacterium]
MAKLSVNVNKVATLRNTRDLGIPSVIRASQICLNAGAHGITVHPRPDQRHIRPSDVHEIAQLLKSYPNSEFNIEGNPFEHYMHYAKDERPTQCTLVPDTRDVPTSNTGWDLTAANIDRLRPVIAELKSYGCRVSLFLNPDLSQVDSAAAIGADRIELYTEPYAAAFARGAAQAADAYVAAANHAKARGLQVNAGHDLNLANLPPLVEKIPFLAEVSIGHALIADALELGLAETVRRYLRAAAGPGH